MNANNSLHFHLHMNSKKKYNKVKFQHALRRKKMKAVILATGHCPGMDPLISYRPTPLLNVADKPIIFYIIEFLVQKGIRNIDLVISHLPEQIEEKLDDGKRWGAEICYHLAKDPNYPFSVPPALHHKFRDLLER